MSQTGRVTYLLVLLSNRNVGAVHIALKTVWANKNRLLAPHTCLLLSNSQQIGTQFTYNCLCKADTYFAQFNSLIHGCCQV